MKVTIGARTSVSSLRTGGCSLSGPASLLGFKPERSFLAPSSVISKGTIWGILGEASFMACLLSCSRDSAEGSEKTDLNWSFSMVAFFLLLFSSLPLLFSGATPCVSCFLYLMNLQNLLLLSYMASSSFGYIMLFMYDQYACHVNFCTNPL